MDISEIMRSRRAQLGMSQAQLAQEADLHVRQIARYESGEQQPLLGVAAKLARALDISLAQLAGEYDHRLDLDGDWWAGWETVKDGEPWTAIQQIKAHQHGSHLQLIAERTRPVDEGGYKWTGELRLWDQEALLGWYRGADGAVRSKGTMYFALHPQGLQARGRWVGLSYDGEVITGHASLARTPEVAERVLRESIERADQP